ncbi:Cochaperone prefoldin complex subunit [Coemansia guatemalensis]|uniref:Cochaperone prefoldin complex subunit n=1 Tax=Coemansia guatemalensis TaxID=2761395 RepID=A0A9W8I1B9_9FUNG|nr:Cochaperone prefoldin complex subunit [Coemansia guatemalensis]
MSSSSSTDKKNSGAPSEQELRLAANQYTSELKAVASKIGELENELNEHALVIKTLSDVPTTRKCHRLINGVLIERTVAEVLPALKTNEDGIQSTIKQLTSQYKAKEKLFIDFQQKHGIRIAQSPS